MYKIYSIALLLFLMGCKPQPTSLITHIEPTCLSNQSRCVVETSNGDFQVLFNVEQVITESEFEITVLYSGKNDIASINGYIEGKDMYMGKIPTFFNASLEESDYRSTTMLGSCSREQMIWRLWLTIELIDKGNQTKTEIFSIDFESTRFSS